MHFRRRKAQFQGIGPLLPEGETFSTREDEQWRDQHTWDPSRGTSLAIEHDLTPAAWLEPRLVPGSFEVRMTSPQGYEAYARIFFPFTDRTTVGADGKAVKNDISWRDLARQNGWRAHALMEQETITWDRATDEADLRKPRSDLSSEQLEALLPILARHTSSTHGWFLLWHGYGDLNERVFNDTVPMVHHPMRDFYLLRGPLSSYRDFPHGPNYWWPEDQAWCVANDTDFAWSYVAASAACIEELLAVSVMDAWETKSENPARSGMDVINEPD